MANVLFIKANDRDQAISLRLYDAFLNAYRAGHPEDRIEELDLFRANLPYYDGAMMAGLFKTARGMEATPEERAAAEVANRYLEQFLAADKIVIAFPMWNFTVPAQLHTYIAYLCQAGKTFKYTAEGPVGLLGDKKVALLTARGGVYTEGEAASREMALNYLKNVLGLMGVTSPETIVVEGHNQFPDRAEQIVGEGVERTAALAAGF